MLGGLLGLLLLLRVWGLPWELLLGLRQLRLLLRRLPVQAQLRVPPPPPSPLLPARLQALLLHGGLLRDQQLLQLAGPLLLHRLVRRGSVAPVVQLLLGRPPVLRAPPHLCGWCASKGVGAKAWVRCLWHMADARASPSSSRTKGAPLSTHRLVPAVRD